MKSNPLISANIPAYLSFRPKFRIYLIHVPKRSNLVLMAPRSIYTQFVNEKCEIQEITLSDRIHRSTQFERWSSLRSLQVIKPFLT